MNHTREPEKNGGILPQPGIGFKDAVEIFDGPTLEQVDNRFDYGEIRIDAIGVSNQWN